MLLAGAALAAGACERPRETGPAAGPMATGPEFGGTVVAALRAEPRTLNPVTMVDNPSRELAWRLHDRLLRVNRETQAVEPALAESWSASDDGRRLRVTLREGLRFSDGHPCTIDDVVFSLGVYLDADVASPQRDLLMVDGRPPRVTTSGDRTVEIEMGGPFAAAARLFDGIAILPRHRLQTAYEAGTLADAWGLATPPGDVVGLGPFRLRQYAAGERVVLERNPHYHRSDSSGRSLPYLDGLTFVFVPMAEATELRLQSGEIHAVGRLAADQAAAIARGDDAIHVRDLGAGLEYEVLVLNQNAAPQAASADVRRRRAWFANPLFRQALSRAIDRQAVARLAYGGRATPIWTPVSPGNRAWFHEAVARPAPSVADARALLLRAGFTWSPAGRLIDGAGATVRFTVVTNAANAARTSTAALLAQDLDALGIEAIVRPLEFRALVQRVLTSFEYDAALMGLGGGDADPNPYLPVLLSSGGTHLWRPAQDAPATPWEAELDAVMRAQVGAIDEAYRRRLFHRAQELLAEQMPMIPLVSPNVLLAHHKRLAGTRPAVLDDHLFWNVEEWHWLDAPGQPTR